MAKENSSTIFFPIILIAIGIFLVWLSVWGLGILHNARNLNEYTSNPPEYLFRFGVIPIDDNTLYLNSARFYYDLTAKQAFLVFGIYEDRNISSIFMQTPDIDNKTIKCFSADWTGLYKEEDINYSEIGCSSTKTAIPAENYNQSLVTIYLDNKTVSNKRIKVEFNLSTEHSFTFNADVYKQDAWYPDESDGNIIINLGKDYECFQDCIYNLIGFNPVYTDNPASERHLTFVNPSKPQYSFKLITKSIKAADDKTQDISAGVGIIVGAIFATITLAIELIKWIFNNLVKRRISFSLGNVIGFITFCWGAILMTNGIVNSQTSFSKGFLISLVGIATIFFTYQKPQRSTDEKLNNLFNGKSSIEGIGAKTINKLKQFINKQE